MGRHTEFTLEMGERILEWIADGKTLSDFCRQDNTPAWRTVYHWLEANSDFQAAYARARDLGADAIAEDALRIADSPLEGKTVTKVAGVTTERIEDMLGHRKLQVETRLKLLAKWNPRRYGEKVELNGPGGGAIIIKTAPLDDAL
jgi:hypothetical protein